MDRKGAELGGEVRQMIVESYRSNKIYLNWQGFLEYLEEQ